MTTRVMIAAMLEVTSSDETWRGKAQVRQNGPMLFVSTTF